MDIERVDWLVPPVLLSIMGFLGVLEYLPNRHVE